MFNHNDLEYSPNIRLYKFRLLWLSLYFSKNRTVRKDGEARVFAYEISAFAAYSHRLNDAQSIVVALEQ